MVLKTYRIEVNTIYANKVEGSQGYLQVFGVTAASLKDAKRAVTLYVKKNNLNNGYTLKIRNIYQAEIDELISTCNFTKNADPNIKGIWFVSGKVYYKKK